MAGYIGAAAVPQATESRDVFTATSNQTSFATSGYTPGFVSVYLNGVHLARADFTATNGSDVVLAAGATEDDTVEIVSFSTFELSAQTFSGNVTIGDGNLVLGSTAVSSTAAELNILDGVTATAAEINLIDGGTARGTTAVADGDGFLTNDGGTMRMTKVDTLATYMGTKIGGAMEFINTTDISDAATYNFTAFDSSKYDAYVLYVMNMLPASDGKSLYCRTSTDGGSNYDSTGGDYGWSSSSRGGGESYITHGWGRICAGVGNETNEPGVSVTITIFAPHLAKPTMINSTGVYNLPQDPGTFALPRDIHSIIVRQANTDVDGFRLYFSSGNIREGTVSVYGVVNS
tara:strand:+ start:147 stop:1184 length:1038 start_codon:yes stop_codon:yes gene_type:complete